MPIGYFGQGAGPGHPDARSGAGYGSVHGGPGNRTRQQGRGYPYDELDLTPEDDFDDEELDELEDEALRISQVTGARYTPNDAFGSHARDRRSFVDSSTFGIANVPVFAEACNRVDELSSTIRLRPRSSEPDAGTIYGWSSPHLTRKPKRVAGVKKPRFMDIVDTTFEEDFEEDLEYHDSDVYEEHVLKCYIRRIIEHDIR